MAHHLTADLTGIPAVRLRDMQVLRSAIVAAAGAVGLGALGSPTVHEGAHATALSLISDGRHLIVHALPEEEALLLDVLAPAVQDSQRALDVFTRRLMPRDVRSATRERPPARPAARG